MGLPFTAVDRQGVGGQVLEQAPSRATRWAPVPSSSTTGPAARRSCSSATRTTSCPVTPTSTSSSSSSPPARRPRCCSCRAARSTCSATASRPASSSRSWLNPTWKKQVTAAPQVAWYYVFMNVHVKPFDNVLVRQAVNYAVDTRQDPEAPLRTGAAAQPGLPGRHGGPRRRRPRFYTHDPAKAKQLLAQAGYPNGFSVTLYTHNVDPMPKLAQTIQYDLAQVGIKAQIKQLAEAPYWGLIERQKGERADRPDRLVHGLPRPVRLHRAALSKLGDHRRQRTRAGGGAPRSRRGCCRRSRWSTGRPPRSSTRCSRIS